MNKKYIQIMDNQWNYKHLAHLKQIFPRKYWGQRFLVVLFRLQQNGKTDLMGKNHKIVHLLMRLSKINAQGFQWIFMKVELMLKGLNKMSSHTSNIRNSFKIKCINNENWLTYVQILHPLFLLLGLVCLFLNNYFISIYNLQLKLSGVLGFWGINTGSIFSMLNLMIERQ